MKAIVLLLFTGSVVFSYGCEKDDAKTYHMTIIAERINNETPDTYDFEVYIKEEGGKVLAQLRPDQEITYDYEGNIGDVLHLSCETGPVVVTVSSYNSTYEGEYEMQPGDEMTVRLDVE